MKSNRNVLLLSGTSTSERTQPGPGLRRPPPLLVEPGKPRQLEQQQEQQLEHQQEQQLEQQQEEQLEQKLEQREQQEQRHQRYPGTRMPKRGGAVAVVLHPAASAKMLLVMVKVVMVLL